MSAPSALAQDHCCSRPAHALPSGGQTPFPPAFPHWQKQQTSATARNRQPYFNFNAKQSTPLAPTSSAIWFVGSGSCGNKKQLPAEQHSQTEAL
eukprot:3097741-Rhodomonas_salina.1